MVPRESSGQKNCPELQKELRSSKYFSLIHVESQKKKYIYLTSLLPNYETDNDFWGPIFDFNKKVEARTVVEIYWKWRIFLI